MLEYIVLVILLAYLSFTAYLKYKLKFWLTQPVFHIYNLWYWLTPPGIIMPEMPTPTLLKQNNAIKYLNLSNIKTLEVDKIKDELICDKICTFIKTNYIVQTPTGLKEGSGALIETLYLPSKKNIIEYYKSTNHPAFFTIYQEPKILFEKGEATSTLNDIIGVISARALNVTLKNQTFTSYYVDNLCVDPLYRKNGIAPQLIQTQCYNLRLANPKIQTCLFKREGQLNALVPLLVFETYCFNLTNLLEEEAGATTVIEIGLPQLGVFTDFVKSQMPYYECVVMPDLTNLMNLLKTENLVIYGILNLQGQLVASFIFRYINLAYDGKKTIECINILIQKENGNHYAANNQITVYETGFMNALKKIREKNNFDYILIENTANAKRIIEYLQNRKNVAIYFKSPTAFFLYNYAVRSLASAELALMVY
jgi:hypothetical protein